MCRAFLLLIPMLLLLGCNKEPGEGGRAEIQGRVMAQNYLNTPQGTPFGEPYPVPEHRVYIIYGDGQFHDDDVRTSADGRFRFTGLRKGSYTVYTISQQYRDATTADASGTFVVRHTVEITDRRAVVDAGDLNIQRWRNY
jgi:hypothetical protein